MTEQDTTIRQLPPLAQSIIDRAIDSMTRKLIAGARNRNDSRPNASTNLASDAKDSLKAASAKSAMDVANRGAAWQELLHKSLTHGISSLGTMKFDGSFTVKNGQAVGLENVPNSPGVYVVFDSTDTPVYVGDSKALQSRWHAGHLNEHRQGERQGAPYKLAQEFNEGCTVKFIQMESGATAAALEAHLIRVGAPKRNARQELDTEQGLRENIEAQKMKNASGSFETLAAGAGAEALKNSGFLALEQLTAAVIKAVKDELVDLALGSTHSIKRRLKRFFEQVWQAVAQVFSAPIKLLTGIFEFIVNAVSKTIAQFYSLARNIFDLGHSAWQLYKGAQTMSRDELIQKISETVLLSGTLILWDALDPVLESQLVPLVGPAAPYLSAAVCAIGFGVSGFYLQKIVPALVGFLVSAMSGATELLQEQRRACEQLLAVQERELRLLSALQDAAHEFVELDVATRAQIRTLQSHTPIARFDVRSLVQ